METSLEHFDVLIVGAGLSGIGAGVHLQRNCPARSYAILEARDRIGGTWDLFRYPGIRSDSDMYTLGYSFKPWEDAKAIADGASILRYVEQTAREHRVDERIRFDHRVVRSQWSSREARWTVEAEHGDTGETIQLTCDFLLMCSGYYRYEEGYTPELPGTERFAGRIVHPQHWSEEIDYAGKRVVVIGSGATAITLVPAMAGEAAHVTNACSARPAMWCRCRRKTGSRTFCAARCRRRRRMRSCAGRTCCARWRASSSRGAGRRR